MLKKNIKLFIGIIIGSIISSGLTYAYTIAANNVSYDNTNSHLKDGNNQAIKDA